MFLRKCSSGSRNTAWNAPRKWRRASWSFPGADYGVSTTGVAGPTAGSAEHPVGEVCIAVSGRNGCRSERFLFAQGSADRELIRALAAEKALSMLLCEIKK